MADSKFQVIEYNPLIAHAPLTLENNLYKYKNNVMNSTSEIENTFFVKKHIIQKRSDDFVQRSHLDPYHHHENAKRNHEEESFYNRTPPKFKKLRRENRVEGKVHFYAKEESASDLQQSAHLKHTNIEPKESAYLEHTSIENSSNDFEELNVPESQMELKREESEHMLLPKLKNAHTSKVLNRYQKHGLRKHSRKHLPLTNENTEKYLNNKFDNKHKRNRNLGYKKESDVKNHFRNHKKFYPNNVDATKKNHFLLNSSRHVRHVNTSRKHHSNSKSKDRSMKKTSQAVKNPKYSNHSSSSNQMRKIGRDLSSRKLKKHHVHGTKHLRNRNFVHNFRKRSGHKKHLRKHKHHGKISLKQNKKVSYHGFGSKNLSKFLKELTNKLYSKNVSKHSINKLLKEYFHKAGKKYHKYTVSKKLYKKYSKLKLPNHAFAVKKDSFANGPKDSMSLSGETTIKPSGSENTINTGL